MSAHILLNLFNELRNSNTTHDLLYKEFGKFNNTEVLKLYSIYYKTLNTPLIRVLT